MDILKQSKRVLKDLLETHAKIKEEYLASVKSLQGQELDTVFWAVRIDMKEHAEALRLTEREFYLCINFLIDQKFIDNIRRDYSKSEGDWQIVLLTPQAFQTRKRWKIRTEEIKVKTDSVSSIS